jgi:hypothetical protein
LQIAVGDCHHWRECSRDAEIPRGRCKFAAYLPAGCLSNQALEPKSTSRSGQQFDFHNTMSECVAAWPSGTANGDANHRRLPFRCVLWSTRWRKVRRVREVFMGETENANSQPRFTRRSDTESICTFCSVSIRVNRYTVLEEAEDIHADVCLVNPDYCVRYVLL